MSKFPLQFILNNSYERHLSQKMHNKFISGLKFPLENLQI